MTADKIRAGLAARASTYYLVLPGVFLCTLLSACSIHTVLAPSVSPREKAPVAAGVRESRDLFVFFDGTSNDQRSATNVWRLFRLVASNGGPATRSLYIEGVGNTRNPITGMILGVGMEARIQAAYVFLAQNYQHGDRIYIFGFSRGAHQARDLAGILSYSGLPLLNATDRDHFDRPAANQIVELTKRASDCDHTEEWMSWTPEQSPLLAKAIKDRLRLHMQTVEIAFLGVWDTVPGSFFKEFGVCRERADRKLGDRYKSGSYPPIHVIAHAVARDEKRSKFRVLLLCPAIDPSRTQIHETWFPGAHSDVGGGYGDVDNSEAGAPLSTISFNWMGRLLSENYKFTTPLPELPENHASLAHWSIDDWPGNLFSDCEDREPPKNFDPDPSLGAREGKSSALLRVKKVASMHPYPLLCPRPSLKE